MRTLYHNDWPNVSQHTHVILAGFCARSLRLGSSFYLLRLLGYKQWRKRRRRRHFPLLILCHHSSFSGCRRRCWRCWKRCLVCCNLATILAFCFCTRCCCASRSCTVFLHHAEEFELLDLTRGRIHATRATNGYATPCSPTMTHIDNHIKTHLFNRR